MTSLSLTVQYVYSKCENLLDFHICRELPLANESLAIVEPSPPVIIEHEEILQPSLDDLPYELVVDILLQSDLASLARLRATSSDYRRLLDDPYILQKLYERYRIPIERTMSWEHLVVNVTYIGCLESGKSFTSCVDDMYRYGWREYVHNLYASLPEGRPGIIQAAIVNGDLDLIAKDLSGKISVGKVSSYIRVAVDADNVDSLDLLLRTGPEYLDSVRHSLRPDPREYSEYQDLYTSALELAVMDGKLGAISFLIGDSVSATASSSSHRIVSRAFVNASIMNLAIGKGKGNPDILRMVLSTNRRMLKSNEYLNVLEKRISAGDVNLTTLEMVIEDLRNKYAREELDICRPLISSAAVGDISMVKYLYDVSTSGDTFKGCNDEGHNLALKAAAGEGGSIEIVEFMLAVGATDYEGSLVTAARWNRTSIVEYLVSRYGRDMISTGVADIVLYNAAEHKNLEMVKMALSIGAVNYNEAVIRAIFMSTVTGLSKSKSSVEIVLLLLEAGADNYSEILDEAVLEDNIDVVRLVIARGGILLGVDNYNKGASEAAGRYYPDIVKLLIEAGANNYQEILLEAAGSEDHWSLTDFTELVNDIGQYIGSDAMYRALLRAAGQENYELVRYLLSHVPEGRVRLEDMVMIMEERQGNDDLEEEMDELLWELMEREWETSPISFETLRAPYGGTFESFNDAYNHILETVVG